MLGVLVRKSWMVGDCPWLWEVHPLFVVMMGGEAVSGGGVLSCICLAPQLVCGCSTRAPLTFFLAWGGWRQRGGCAGFLCRTRQVTVRERGRYVLNTFVYAWGYTMKVLRMASLQRRRRGLLRQRPDLPTEE